MMYIEAEKLKERISRLRDEFIKKSETKGYTTLEYRHKAEGLSLALQYIDSLQREQQEVDLEKEVKEYIKKNFTITDEIAAIPEKDRMYSMGSDDLLYLAYYFIQLGLNARMEE